MSARSFLQSPSLAKQASLMKEKVLEKSGKILARKSSSSQSGVQSGYLSREEVLFLMDHVKTIILHLRARLRLESKDEQGAYKRSDIFGTQDEQQSKEKALSDARTIRTVAETGAKNLQNALVKFTAKSIAQVIKLVFKSAEVPLLRAEILAEILSVQDTANKNKVAVDIDDLRSVLGKAPARHIDILGQLIALLAMDVAGVSRMAYSWSTFIFFPRYDIKNSATKEYEGFDIGRQMPLTVSITQMMIEQVGEVFGLDDDEYIRRLGAEIVDIQQADMRLAYEQHVRTTAPVAAPSTSTPVKAGGGNKAPQKQAVTAAPKVIGMCLIAYDFQAENKNELDVAAGEECYILEKGSDEWWKVRVIADGREGLVPETYAEEVAWDGTLPQEEEEDLPEEKEEYHDNEENDSRQHAQHYEEPQYEEEESQQEEEEQGEVINDQIAELERQLNALKAAAQATTTTTTRPSSTINNKPSSKINRADSVESSPNTPGQRVRSTIQSKTFDEQPSMTFKSPPAPGSSKMGPPPLPPLKAQSVQLKPVPMIPQKPAENQSRATNMMKSPAMPQRITSAPSANKAEPRVATPMPPSRHSSNANNNASERPQLDLNAILKQRAARLSAGAE